MTWLSRLGGDGRLCEAVSHVNEALDLLEQDGREADATRCLTDALSKIQAVWWQLQTPVELDHVGAFQAMLAQAISAEAQAELLSSDEVANSLGPKTSIVTDDDESNAHLLEPLARFVCTGPGREQAVIPVQLLLVNLLLDKPDERLVIYGTLAPGRENHDVIEDLSGRYSGCTVHGLITEVDGLPYFTWAPAADGLEAQLFCSNQLPEKWDDLDRFEGSGYKRRLIMATSDGGLSVASIYLSTADDWWSSPGH